MVITNKEGNNSQGIYNMCECGRFQVRDVCVENMKKQDVGQVAGNGAEDLKN